MEKRVTYEDRILYTSQGKRVKPVSCTGKYCLLGIFFYRRVIVTPLRSVTLLLLKRKRCFLMTQFPEYRISSKPTDVRIASLNLERKLYDNYPPFQREKVWSDAMKRCLIDSLLRGFYMPPILVFRQVNLPTGHRFWVVDGQQRLTTIFDFMDDKFTTLRLRDEPNYSPIEPNRRYSQLSLGARDLLENYTVHIRLLEGIDESELGVLFRRLQNQQPLLGSEKLWSYSSETTRRASELADHPFWKEVYTGRRDRKRDFQAGLYLIFVELFNGFANVTTPRLRDLAAGSKDSMMTPDLVQTIWKRLDEVNHVFYGTSLHSMNEVIPVYQAVLFLDEAQYDLKKSEQGCLSAWFGKIKQESLVSRRANGISDFLAKIVNSGYQRQFWIKELPRIMETEGLFAVNKKRSFDELDRIQAWNRQQGICPVCGKTVRLADAAHHIIRFADGGPTTPENCAVVHKECHAKIHGGRIGERETVQNNEVV